MALPIPANLFNAAQFFLECACEALAAASCGCPDCRCVNVAGPGLVSWDHCCGGGQLYVNVENLYPFGSFPAPATLATPCRANLAVAFVVGIVRCAPSVKDDGSPPSCAEISQASLIAMEDAYLIQHGIQCCLAALGARCCYRFVMGGTTFVGPEGGCMGSETRFVVELGDPFDCVVPE